MLLEDFPGLGKTLAARSFAQALGLDFARAQFTPDLLPADLTGSFLYDQRAGRRSSSAAGRCSPACCWPTRSTGRRPRPSRRCSRRCRSARSPSRARPSRCRRRSTCSRPPTRSSTKAPTRCPRPSSTGSCCGSSFGYPTARRGVRRRSPRRLARQQRGGRRSTRSPTPPGCWRCRPRSRRCTVDESVGRYCVDLAAATRDHPDVLTGASPRGSLGLVLAARAFARAARPRLRHPRGRQGRRPRRCSRTGSRSSPSSG